MKNIILILIIFAIFSPINAEITSLKFYMVDGSYKTFELSEIQNLEITQNATNSILYIYYQKTKSENFITSIIDTMKFEGNDFEQLVLKIYTSEGVESFLLSEIDSLNCKILSDTFIPVSIIPPGSFQMGNTGQFIGDTTETPVHNVTLTKSIYMGKYEITQAQWKSVMGDHFFDYPGDNLPANPVCWFEAIDFCNKLSEIDGLEKCYTINLNSAKKLCDERVTVDFDTKKNGWRLPTEAEWEYACKAGTTSDYYTGDLLGDKNSTELDSNLDKAAWFDGNYNWGYPLNPGGLKQPNSFGLYDMLGNVFELCWDWWAWNWKYEIGDVTDPTGPVKGYYRSARSGSSFLENNKCRSSSRDGFVPYLSYELTGLRICRNN